MKFYDLTSYTLLKDRFSRFRSSLCQLLLRRRYDILGVTLPLLAFLAWLLSLRSIHLNAMNDLGLVSVFNPLTLFSLASLSVSFCLLLHQRPLRDPLLLLHVLLLIFMLYCYAWLRAPDEQAPPLPLPQRIALLSCLLVVFAFIDFSHPLTPFFVLTSVWALVLFRRCTPLWLPIVLTLMTVAWIVFMAQAYLIGHFANAFGSGGLSSSITSNLTQHVIGNAEHTLVAQIRIIMTVLGDFALLGGIRRLRAGYHDITYVLLAVAPFPLLVAQSYGGEMLLLIYLFSLAMMTFFAASLFFITPQQDRSLSVPARWLSLHSLRQRKYGLYD